MFNSVKKGLSIALAGVMAVSMFSVSSVETKAAEVGEYNYAKLLQESLYFYDGNMCGKDVGEKSAFSWRDDCHTTDTVTIDGQTNDVSGGYHDADDHGKFGLPQAYSATMLGISYYEFSDAYAYAGASEHLKTITGRFCEYFEKCTVLNSDGTVKCFVYQVGDYTDHNYWGAPENQTGNRPVFYTTDSNTATDEVSEAASALTLQYLNFGDQTALDYAKKLFAYAKNHDKSCATEGLWDPATGGLLYNSTSWGDDYALAAALLYKATNDQSYKTEFDNVKNQSLGNYNIWAWCSWDDVSAIADFYGTGSAYSLNECAKNMKKSDNGYSCLLEWGSCRYNCNTQFLGLLYDKANNSSSYKDWATFQMNYILGNNNKNQCYVVGYNANSSQYPHHRAASGSGDANQISVNKKTLLGALVGGPKDANGTYTDSQGDYQCNEVALDYNAGLVCAAAALYHVHKDNPNVPKDLMDSDDITGIELDFAYNDILDECDHDYQEVAGSAVPAGCLTGGKEADKKCSKCGDVIEGAKIDALGHDYKLVAGSAVEASCTKEGKEADKKCSRCDSVITGATIGKTSHTEVIDPRVEPTTTTVGWTQGSHCEVCKAVIIPQEEIPMIVDEECDHDYQEVAGSALPAGCLTGGKEANKKCTKCGYIIEGAMTGALGHDYQLVAGSAVEASCAKEGKEADKKCSRCDSVITGATIGKKPHTEVIDPRVEPTTTTVGWTQGSHCDVCKAVIIPQEEIPMKTENNENDENDNKDDEKENENANDNPKDNKQNDKENIDNNTQDNNSNGNKDNNTNNNKDSAGNNNNGSSTEKPSNEWIKGKWYNEDGSQTYQGTLMWKCNSTGWWVEDTDGWYPTDQWQKIDGVWYYFKPDGYMAMNEYYNGYWFNSDGSWDDQYLLSWKVNSTGWWVEDISGWWPSSSWLKISGYWYYFNASGYMVTNQYVDGYWIGSDGVCY